MSGNKKVSTLADESDILANIEAEKAAAVKAAKDKRQKAAALRLQKFKLNSRSLTMALAKSISGTISGGLAKAAKRASAAPEEKTGSGGRERHRRRIRRRRFRIRCCGQPRLAVVTLATTNNVRVRTKSNLR